VVFGAISLVSSLKRGYKIAGPSRTPDTIPPQDDSASGLIRASLDSGAGSVENLEEEFSLMASMSDLPWLNAKSI